MHQSWPHSARASSSSTWAPCWSRTRSSSSSMAGTAKCRAWTPWGTCRQPWLAACTPCMSPPECEEGPALPNHGGGVAGAVFAFCIFLRVPCNRHPLVLREGELASLCCCCHRNDTHTNNTAQTPAEGARGESQLQRPALGCGEKGNWTKPSTNTGA